LFAAADIHCQPNAGPESFGIAFVEAPGGIRLEFMEQLEEPTESRPR